MNERTSRIGYSQRVRLEWLDAAADLILAGNDKKRHQRIASGSAGRQGVGRRPGRQGQSGEDHHHPDEDVAERPPGAGAASRRGPGPASEDSTATIASPSTGACRWRPILSGAPSPHTPADSCASRARPRRPRFNGESWNVTENAPPWDERHGAYCARSSTGASSTTHRTRASMSREDATRFEIPGASPG